jgi:hypothetical protein
MEYIITIQARRFRSEPSSDKQEPVWGVWINNLPLRFSVTILEGGFASCDAEAVAEFADVLTAENAARRVLGAMSVGPDSISVRQLEGLYNHCLQAS